MPLESLFEHRIIQPLGLTGAAYDPQGEIEGPHSRGYRVSADGGRVDATAWHGGTGAEGGIVANAEDEARFLMALMQGKLLRPAELTALKTPASSIGSDYALGFVVAQERLRRRRLRARRSRSRASRRACSRRVTGGAWPSCSRTETARTTPRTTLASTRRRSASTAPPDRRRSGDRATRGDNSGTGRRRSIALGGLLPARRVAPVEDQRVAVGITEGGEVTDPRVPRLGDELDALRLELGASRGDIVHA